MDRPGLEPDQHRRALEGLATLNFLSRSVGILWPRIALLGRQLGRPVRILDIATGGGDVPWEFGAVPKRPASRSISWESISAPRAGSGPIAGQRAQAKLRFVRLDALHDALPGDHDIVICSLFLHHLDACDVILLLGHMAAAARHKVLVNDLVRSKGRLMFVATAARLLTRSPVVWTDAALSVRAAFTVREMHELARAAGMDDIRLTRHWFCRMLLEWSRP